MNIAVLNHRMMGKYGVELEALNRRQMLSLSLISHDNSNENLNAIACKTNGNDNDDKKCMMETLIR